MSREECRLRPAGEENEPAVAEGRSSRAREAVSGQTCPIETAGAIQCIGKTRRLASSLDHSISALLPTSNAPPVELQA